MMESMLWKSQQKISEKNNVMSPVTVDG